MNRDSVLSAVALVLAVAALGTVAGGLSTGETGPGDTSPGVGIGAGEGSGAGNGSGLGFNLSGATDVSSPPWLGKGLVLAAIWGTTVVTGASVVLFLWNASLREVLRAAARVLASAVGLGILLAGLLALLFFLAALFESGGGGIMGSSSTAGLDVPGAVESPSPDPVTGVVLLAGGALVIVVLVTVLTARDDPDGSTPDARWRRDRERETIADDTLRAEGEILDPAATNDVYRVWRELSEQVGDRDRAESPGDLRRRAKAAGYDEQAIGELTTLFNAVRYGEAGATAARERRARELRTRLARNGRDRNR